MKRHFALSAGARRALAGGRAVAGATNAATIQPAHILAGILDQRPTRVLRLLNQLKCDPAELTRALADVTGPRRPPPPATGPRLTYSGASKQVIVRAQKEAATQSSPEFEVEDLLVALALSHEEPVAGLLSSHGITADGLRAAREDSAA